jgi:hypothetical protein
MLAVTLSVPHLPSSVLSFTTYNVPSTSKIAQLLSPAILDATSHAESEDLVASLETLIDDVFEMSGSATKFNPNHVAGWALILINPIATVEERTNAKMEVLRLDPLNKQFKNFHLIFNIFI